MHAASGVRIGRRQGQIQIDAIPFLLDPGIRLELRSLCETGLPFGRQRAGKVDIAVELHREFRAVVDLQSLVAGGSGRRESVMDHAASHNDRSAARAALLRAAEGRVTGGHVVSARTYTVAAAVIAVALVSSACLPGGQSMDSHRPAGFFFGIWHGWIAPLSLIVGIFEPGVRIYEVDNTGLAYDFGFYIAVIGGFGGISLFRLRYS